MTPRRPLFSPRGDVDTVAPVGFDAGDDPAFLPERDSLRDEDGLLDIDSVARMASSGGGSVLDAGPRSTARTARTTGTPGRFDPRADARGPRRSRIEAGGGGETLAPAELSLLRREAAEARTQLPVPFRDLARATEDAVIQGRRRASGRGQIAAFNAALSEAAAEGTGNAILRLPQQTLSIAEAARMANAMFTSASAAVPTSRLPGLARHCATCRDRAQQEVRTRRDQALRRAAAETDPDTAEASNRPASGQAPGAASTQEALAAAATDREGAVDKNRPDRPALQAGQIIEAEDLPDDAVFDRERGTYLFQVGRTSAGATIRAFGRVLPDGRIRIINVAPDKAAEDRNFVIAEHVARAMGLSAIPAVVNIFAGAIGGVARALDHDPRTFLEQLVEDGPLSLSVNTALRLVGGIENGTTRFAGALFEELGGRETFGQSREAFERGFRDAVAVSELATGTAGAARGLARRAAESGSAQAAAQVDTVVASADSAAQARRAWREASTQRNVALFEDHFRPRRDPALREEFNRNAYDDRFEGTPGMVIVGRPGDLMRSIIRDLGGIPSNGNWPELAGHHLIPLQLRNHSLLNRVGMNMDHASNGMPIPRTDVLAQQLGLPKHSGRHASYTAVIENQLDKLMERFPDSSNAFYARQIVAIREHARLGLLRNLPLHGKDREQIKNIWSRWMSELKLPVE